VFVEAEDNDDYACFSAARYTVPALMVYRGLPSDRTLYRTAAKYRGIPPAIVIINAYLSVI